MLDPDIPIEEDRESDGSAAPAECAAAEEAGVDVEGGSPADGGLVGATLPGEAADLEDGAVQRGSAGLLGGLGDICGAAFAMVPGAINAGFSLFMGGSYSEREHKARQPTVDLINSLEPQVVSLSDEQLRGKTGEFKKRLSEGETIEQLLPEAYAVAREAADRRLGMCNVLGPELGFDPDRLDETARAIYELARRELAQGKRVGELMLPASFYDAVREACPEQRAPFRRRAFDVQLHGAMALNDGNIAEMATGEGKTLVATLTAYLNALEGRLQIVTVNDYLAMRDAKNNAPMFEALGLKVGAIQAAMSSAERKPQYQSDIVYGTANQFGFDYLRDNMRTRETDQVQGPLRFAIIDEVDSILVDEARTPLIISEPSREPKEQYLRAKQLMDPLVGEDKQKLNELTREERAAKVQEIDFTYNPKTHRVSLTERGLRAVEDMLGVADLYSEENQHWLSYIDCALKAKALYKLDRDYILRDGRVVIVDNFTGRQMADRSWSDGLHQAVQAKEGVEITGQNQTLATITLQSFFKQYEKLAGMTGTAMTQAEELTKTYGMDVLPIPTNRPLIREEYPQRVLGGLERKWESVVDEITLMNAWGRPVLIGTVSVEDSEKLSRKLSERGITHRVLNAKEHGREAAIVAEAGQFGAVTVATNMAGRGTDIMLGDCSWQQAFEHWKANGLAPAGVEADSIEEAQQAAERHLYREWVLEREKPALGEPAIEERLAGLDAKEIHRLLEEHCHGRGTPVPQLGGSVAELGGLHVIGTERHEARRIDFQLGGRAGRQGDPGSYRFFVSLEDDLFRKFMPGWAESVKSSLGITEKQAVNSGMVSRGIERAQIKVEEHFTEIRRKLLESDEIRDNQRKIVYGERQELISAHHTEGKRTLAEEQALKIVRAQIIKMVGQALGKELEDSARARSFGSLRRIGAELGVEIGDQEWREADPHKLHGLFVERMRAAYPGGNPIELCAGLVTQAARASFSKLASSGLLKSNPSYDFAFDLYQQSYLSDFHVAESGRSDIAEAANRVARQATDALIAAKRNEYRRAGTDLPGAVEELLTWACDLQRDKTGDHDLTTAALCDMAGRFFGVAISPRNIARETGNDKEALGRISQEIEKRFAERGVDALAGEVLEAACKQYMGSAIFPGSWKTEQLDERLNEIGLGTVVRVKDLDEQAIMEAAEQMAEVVSESMSRAPAEAIRSACASIVLRAYSDAEFTRGGNDLYGLARDYEQRFGLRLDPFVLSKLDGTQIERALLDIFVKTYESIKLTLGDEATAAQLQDTLLGCKDAHWRAHLEALDRSRDAAALRGLAGQDPDVEFPLEADKDFTKMREGCEVDVSYYILKDLLTALQHTGRPVV